MVDFSKISLEDEKVVKVVNRFKEYGIGIRLGKYSVESQGHTLYHDLVYGNIVVNQDQVIALKLQEYINEASKFESLKAIRAVATIRDCAYELPVKDEFGDKIKIQWEDLAIFTWACLVKRENVELYKKERAEFELLLKDKESNKTPEEIRTAREARIAELSKRYGNK